MKLLLLKLQLGLNLVLFTAGLMANKSEKVKPATVVVFIVLLLTIMFFLISQTQPTVEPEEKYGLEPTNKELYQLRQLTDEQAQEELDFLLEIYQKQPRSRDILINIAQLYTLLGNQGEADFFLQEAIIIDPNHPALELE